MSRIAEDHERQIMRPETYRGGNTDSEDEGIHDGRPSGELSDGDHDILEEEEERERLLITREGIQIGKRTKAEQSIKKGRGKRRGGQEEASHLMYEMEEGHAASTLSVSRGSSESDEQRLIATATQRKVSWF